MKITHTEIWTVVVPTIPGSVHSEVYGPAGWDQVPKHILRLHTDEGLTGIGETARGCPLEAVQAGARMLEGRDPTRLSLQNVFVDAAPQRQPEITRSWENLPNSRGGPAYDAFEMAVFDILGQFRGVPVHMLLGGAFRDRVPADYWMGQQTPEESATTARRGQERGFHGVKIKCTVDEPIVARLQAICDACGPEFKVTVDPNTRFYRPAEAIAVAKEFEKVGNVAALEDPVAKWNLDWYRQIRATTTIPVALHLANPHDIINAIKAEAADYFNLGGSMVQFVKNAAIAEAAGIPCWHGSGCDLGITETAYLHAASVACNCVLPSDLVGSWTREDDLITDGLHFEAGHALVPTRPGLGCELDMDALERYRVA
jgi:muconate cycloisomerase